MIVGLVVLQLKVKKRLMYGAIIITWIGAPAFVTTMGCLATDVVKGMCVPWGSYDSYAAEKIITSLSFSFTYFVPLMLTVFCYSRIVYELLTRKVTRPAFQEARRVFFYRF